MKFKDRKIIQFLTKPAVKAAIGLIPFGIGSAASNVLNNVNGSEPGETDGQTFYVDMFKMAFYAILAVLVLRGSITPDEAEVAKTIIGK